MAQVSSTSSGLVIIEKLEGANNYNNWKFVMKMSLIMDNLWACVEGTETDENKNQKALAKICLNVHPSCFVHVREATNAKDAWTNLQKAFENTGLCRRLALLRKLLRSKYEDFRNMDEYISAVMSLVQQLADINHNVDDEEVAMIILGGLPSEFDPLIMGIEATHTTISTEMVKSRLLQDDYRRGSLENTSSESALAARKVEVSTTKRSEPICFHCGKKGHIKPKCKYFKKGQKKKYLSNDDKYQKQNDNVLLTTALFTTTFGERDWIIDSGCTMHMTKNRDWLSKFENNSRNVTVANNQTIQGIGMGQVNIKLDNAGAGTITDVMYVPDISANLLSVNKLTEKNLTVVFDKDQCKIYKDCKIKGECKYTATKTEGIYKLNYLNEILPNANITKSEKSLYASVSPLVWHKRLGHLSESGMSQLQNVAIGMNFKRDYESDEIKNCIPCIEGKQKRETFPKHSTRRATQLLELIHTDVCGPMSEPTWSGARYLLTFTDDFSRKTFGYLLKTKDQVFEKFIEFKILVENQTNLKIKKVRSDNGKEYMSKKFEFFFRKNGILHEKTIPYSPQQNGVAERLNRTIIEKTRTMLQDSGLERRYWGEAVMTAIYLKNRSPTSAIPGAIPEEIWTGRKVDLSNLKVFGCKAFALIPSELRKKLDAKSAPYIMVGYCDDSKGYRLLDLKNPGKIVRSRDVIFLENLNDNVEKQEEMSEPQIIPENSQIFFDHLNVNNDSMEVKDSSEDEHSTGSEYIPSADDNSSSTISPEESENEVQGEVENRNERPVRGTRNKIPERLEDYELSFYTDLMPIDDEPETFEECMQDTFKDKWVLAMKDEYESLVKNQVLIVDRPTNANVIKCKWVYKVKRDASGNFERFKARVVAKGCNQKYNIDYKETFSPVVRHSTLRLLFAFANEKDMNVDHIDITTAFLNSDLTEKIYMEQPEGFVIGSKDKVCLLKKSIYGLKQASYHWNKNLHKVLIVNEYIQSKCEPCVYIKRKENSLSIIAVYVDDLFVISNSIFEKKCIVESLKQNFDAKDLGPVKNCLGMKVTRDRKNGILTLDQSEYIKKTLGRFGMTDAKTVLTPMTPNIKLTKSKENSNLNEKYPYQQLIGALMYLSVCTRPDISFACSQLSQFSNCFEESHWQEAKRILRYLKGTTNHGLVYKRSNDNLSMYVDADWGNDVSDRRSYTGYVVRFGDCTVNWESRKQKTVALSSTEAEYLALSDASKETSFIRNFMNELVNIAPVVTIYNDNQSAIKIIENCYNKFHKRTKHIEIRYHHIRDLKQNGFINVLYMPTEKMDADMLTKPLGKEKHIRFKENLNILDITV